MEPKMDRQKASALAELYRDELFERVIPFWENNSIDTEHGGYLSCLDRKGNVYDTDKFMWLQCRQMWVFSMLYNRHEKNENWINIAKHGADFLAENGMDDDGNWYFVLDRTGQPLIQPYYLFSDCFAAMAFAQYSVAAGDEQARDIAMKTYHNILKRKDDPKGKYSKAYPGSRPLKMMAMPMIIANLTLEMADILDTDVLEETLDLCVSEVMDEFLDDELNLIYEHISPDGSHPDCFDGRLMNPGHAIESMWFLMDIAQRRSDTALIQRTADVIISTLEFGWDKVYDGIFYFLDIQDKPPLQLEWDQKLWWVHVESLVALSKAYSLTRRDDCLQWYEKLHKYTWEKFADSKHDEWYGYLDRQGDVLLDMKGGKWKGCFHIPRALYLCYKEFEKLSESLK